MRDTNRMKPFFDELEKVWKENFPDWRFGQLISNFLFVYGDPFYWEENKFIENLKEYVKLNKSVENFNVEE